MVLIKSFLTRVLHDHSELIYMYLSKGYETRECYSCLKLVMQANLRVGFFAIFLKNMFYLSTTFKQRNNHEVSYD